MMRQIRHIRLIGLIFLFCFLGCAGAQVQRVQAHPEGWRVLCWANALTCYLTARSKGYEAEITQQLATIPPWKYHAQARYEERDGSWHWLILQDGYVRIGEQEAGDVIGLYSVEYILKYVETMNYVAGVVGR